MKQFELEQLREGLVTLSREAPFGDGSPGPSAIQVPVELATDRLARFCGALDRAISLGFLGPRERTRLVERHILEPASLGRLLPDRGTVVDVGSGAGVPGMVLACIRRDPVVLVESEQRRAEFLREVVSDLRLEASVECARAERAARSPELRDAAVYAVSRALAPPPVALELTLPFARPGGCAVLVVAANVALGPVERSARVLGGAEPRICSIRAPAGGPDVRVVVVEKVTVTPERYPRREGIPAKRPLGSAE